MKKISLFPVSILAIFTVLLTACGGSAAAPTAISPGAKVEPIPVAFIGSVDSIAGDQWVINGKTVTVSADVIRNGPFSIGDAVKVEGLVNSDGSFTVSKVEAPTPQDVSSLPQFGDDSSSTGGNENAGNENMSNENTGNENSGNENAVNENEGNQNGGNENTGIGTGGNENAGNENESNENISNENGSNENESNENGSNENESHGNGGNENGSNENEGNGNGGNDSD